MSTRSITPPPSIVTEAATFIGIDYHKRYSVWHAIDAAGSDLGKGRIEHHSPHDFATLLKRWPNARVVFEGSGVSVQLLDSLKPKCRCLDPGRNREEAGQAGFPLATWLSDLR